MSLQFQNPWLLYWIWIVPALTTVWIMQKRRALKALAAFVSPVMQPRLLPASGARRHYVQTILAGLGALLLLIAAAGPQWGEREETVIQQSRDLVIAIDVSLSMLANDIHPSRLQRAKADALDLIDGLKGDRAALLAFRAKPVLVCPLTTDYAFLRGALAGIDPGSAPRGETDIGAAITRALDAFSGTEASHKAMILISDGEDLSGLAIEMAETAGKRGIPIYTVGLGSRSGSTIPDPQQPGSVLQHEGAPVITKLDHESLLTIAQKSGGSYIPIETAGTTQVTLGNIYSDHLRNVSRRELAETRKRRAVERFQWFLLPAILLLAGAAALSRGRVASVSTTTRQRVAIATVLFLPLIASAETNAPSASTSTSTNAPGTQTNALALNLPEVTGHAAAREAQRRHRQGDYAAAAALYQRAQDGSVRDAERTYRYNQAVALAAAGQYRDAAELFRSLSLQGRRGDLNATPALGAMLYQMAEKTEATTVEGATTKVDALRQAGEAFKEALRTEPDADARHNLALTLKQIPAAEEAAKGLRLATQYGQTPAPALTDQMLKTQREIAVAILATATNPLPARIAGFEALAQLQKDNADRWIPLKQKLTEALAQQQQQTDPKRLESLYSRMQVSEANMQDSTRQLRDIQDDAYRAAKLAEQGAYQLWKDVASHEMLLGEGMIQQTQAIEQVAGRMVPDPTLSPSELQTEAAELTELFRTRFEAAVPPEGTVQPTAETNDQETAQAPEGITPEVRQQILTLATEAAKQQREAATFIQTGADAQASQQSAYEKLETIASLLPKQKQNPQEQPQEQPKEQPQEQPQPQEQEQPKEQPKEQQQQPEQQDKPEKADDIQKLLKRALEREREFEEEKRNRQQRIPLPPSARDW